MHFFLNGSLSQQALPAGYMEMGESSAEGAARETMEEAQAAVEVSFGKALTTHLQN